eukprot:1987033-Alexandrium_andersonii.AAC.1
MGQAARSSSVERLTWMPAGPVSRQPTGQGFLRERAARHSLEVGAVAGRRCHRRRRHSPRAMWLAVT